MFYGKIINKTNKKEKEKQKIISVVLSLATLALIILYSFPISKALHINYSFC